jgi:Cu/Ag efflux pump CusA
MVGGMLSSTLLTLLVIPAIYSLWKEREAREQTRAAAEPVVVDSR